MPGADRGCYLSHPRARVFIGANRRAVKVRKTSIINGGGVGVQVNSSDVTIAQCIIGGSAGDGIVITDSVCKVENNEVFGNQHGITVNLGAGFTIRGNGIDRNREHGVNIAASTVGLIEGNVLHQNAMSFAMFPLAHRARLGHHRGGCGGERLPGRRDSGSIGDRAVRHLPRWWRIGRCEGLCPRQRRQLERVPHREVFEHAHGRLTDRGIAMDTTLPGRRALRPLGRQSEPLIGVPRILIVHTMVGGLRGTDSMFRGQGYTGTESHFASAARATGPRWTACCGGGRPSTGRPTRKRRQRLCHLGGDLRRRRPVPALVGPPAHRAGGPGRLVVPAGGRVGAWWTPPAVAVSATTHSSASGHPTVGPAPARSASSSCARSSSRAWPPRCPAPPPPGRREAQAAVPTVGRLLRYEPGRPLDRHRRQAVAGRRGDAHRAAGRKVRPLTRDAVRHVQTEHHLTPTASSARHHAGARAALVRADPVSAAVHHIAGHRTHQTGDRLDMATADDKLDRALLLLSDVRVDIGRIAERQTALSDQTASHAKDLGDLMTKHREDVRAV